MANYHISGGMAEMTFTSELARVAFPIKPFLNYLNKVLPIKSKG